MSRFKVRESGVVITEADVKALQTRLESLIPAIRRNLIHADEFRDELDEIVNNIYYDIRFAVIDAWAESYFPWICRGMTTAEAGRFDWTSFKLFQKGDADDGILKLDKFDRKVASMKRKSLDGVDDVYLSAGAPVFRAVRNIVTNLLQFASGRYSTEEETVRWIEDHNYKGVRSYGAFVDMSGGCCGADEPVRFIPLDAEDPSAEGMVFLGWVFARSKDVPEMSWGSFGAQFDAICQFEKAVFTKRQVKASSFECSVGHDWPETAN